MHFCIRDFIGGKMRLVSSAHRHGAAPKGSCTPREGCAMRMISPPSAYCELARQCQLQSFALAACGIAPIPAYHHVPTGRSNMEEYDSIGQPLTDDDVRPECDLLQRIVLH